MLKTCPCGSTAWLRRSYVLIEDGGEMDEYDNFICNNYTEVLYETQGDIGDTTYECFECKTPLENIENPIEGAK